MSRQIDKKESFQIRVDKEWWGVLSYYRTLSGMTFKKLVECALSDSYITPEEYKQGEGKANATK